MAKKQVKPEDKAPLWEQPLQTEDLHCAPPLCVGVILAAGASSRMGTPKALLDFSEEKTFLSHLSDVLARGGCDGVLCVTGCHTAQIAQKLPQSVMLLRNDRWQLGQISSVRVGLLAALRLRPTRILVHLVDQPAIQETDVHNLLFGPKVAASQLAIAAFEGTLGHPISLSPSAAREVATDMTSTTLREALKRACPSPLLIPCSEGCLKSANTPEELSLLRPFFSDPRRS